MQKLEHRETFCGMTTTRSVLTRLDNKAPFSIASLRFKEHLPTKVIAFSVQL